MKGKMRYRKDYERILSEGFHMDANETAFGLQELQAIQAENVRVEYAENVMRSLVPVFHGIPSWAETWAYYMVDERSGHSHDDPPIITHMSDEFPLVDVDKQKFVHSLYRIGRAYRYSLDEILASVRGFNLPVEKGAAARVALERDTERVMAFGHATLGLEGFFNHSAIPLTATPNGGWPTATSEDILEDVYTAVTTPFIATLGRHKVNTLAVPLSSLVILETRAVDATNQRKLIDIVRDTFPGLDIVGTDHLENADVAGTGERIVAFEKSEQNFKMVISQEYQEEPPEKHNLTLHVPCHMKLGGVAAIRPLTANYMDIA